MKYYRINLIICILILIFTFSSCKKWLDVNPKTQVKEGTLFETKQGITDALISVYQNAAKSGGYGQNLSFGLLDILAQRYEGKAGTADYYGQLARYNYVNLTNNPVKPEDIIKATWVNMYGSVSIANLVLKHVDEGKGLLTAQEYSIIKGEALGMRAFCHFDLARMFASAYGINPDKPAIPYVKEFKVVPTNRVNLAAVLEQCELDLKEAETLLSVYPSIDQIAGNQGSTSSQNFLMYRQNRFNYWAVKATLARLYLYKGDKINALKYAREVINSGKFSFIPTGTIESDPTKIGSDLTFSPEHIFSIYVSDLKAKADEFLKSTTLTVPEAQDLFSTRAKLDAIYETSVTNYGSDIRNVGSGFLWNVLSANYVYNKKYYSDLIANVKQRLVPVIRLPEMYYIAAESAPTLDNGVGYLNVVRTARLIPALPVPASQAVLDAELLKEYRKEFYGEGQLWFYYKRKNTLNIPDGVGNPMTDAKYVFKLPEQEIEFGQ